MPGKDWRPAAVPIAGRFTFSKKGGTFGFGAGRSGAAKKAWQSRSGAKMAARGSFTNFFGKNLFRGNAK